MNKKRLIVIIAIALLAIGSGTAYSAATKCASCGGNGYRICTPCKGTGKIRTGTITSSKGTQITYGSCPTCKGTGKIICSVCGGKGWRNL